LLLLYEVNVAILLLPYILEFHLLQIWLKKVMTLAFFYFKNQPGL